ncbi:17-beta-HSD 10, partial [Intoshia linei]
MKAFILIYVIFQATRVYVQDTNTIPKIDTVDTSGEQYPLLDLPLTKYILANEYDYHPLDGYILNITQNELFVYPYIKLSRGIDKDTTLYLFFMSYSVVCFIFGLFGNIAMLCIMFRLEMNTTNAYIFNLALHDFLALSYIIYIELNALFFTFKSTMTFCMVSSVFQSYLNNASIFTLVTMAIEKYCAFCKTVYYKIHSTLTRTFLTIILLNIVSSAIDLNELYRSNSKNRSCSHQYDLGDSLTDVEGQGQIFLIISMLINAILLVVIIFIPLIIMMYCYFHISIKIYQAVHRFKKIMSDKKRLASKGEMDKRIQIIKMFILLSGIFFIFWAPYICVRLYITWVQLSDFKRFNAVEGYYSSIDRFSRLYAICSCAIDPWIYLIMFSTYGNQFKKIFPFILVFSEFNKESEKEGKQMATQIFKLNYLSNTHNTGNNLKLFITGGGSGLGRATAIHFSKIGSDVSFCDIAEDKSLELVKENPQIKFFKADVTSNDQMSKAIDNAKNEMNGLNVLINCAGKSLIQRLIRTKPLGMYPLDTIREMFEINTLGTINCIRHASVNFANNEPDELGQRGVIINTGSSFVGEGSTSQYGYIASKAAIQGVTLCLSRELASSGIRINCIAPGIFKTNHINITRNVIKNIFTSLQSWPQDFGEPEYFASTVEHIISNPFINGATIRLDADNWQHSKILKKVKDEAIFDEKFDWPIGTGLTSDDEVKIELITYSKFLTDKCVGTVNILMQELINVGELEITENLIDDNNKMLEIGISFTMKYISPEANTDPYEHWKPSNLDTTDVMIEVEKDNEIYQVDGSSHTSSEDSMDDIDSNIESKLSPYEIQSKKSALNNRYYLDQKPKDIQVTVNIIEIKNLPDQNCDPVVKIQVGEVVKHTSIRRSTDCPYFNEYFVFDFFDCMDAVLENMIYISVYNCLNIPGRTVMKVGNIVPGTLIGQFKIDIYSVYNESDHSFHDKWASLTDPKDLTIQSRGYIKVDIDVSLKGDITAITVNLSNYNKKNILKRKRFDVITLKCDDENQNQGIMENLLIPSWCTVNVRQPASFNIHIYRAADLPRLDMGVFQSITSKIVNTEPTDDIDAYVRVSLGGQSCKTTCKQSYNPEWNEVIHIVDLLPTFSNFIIITLMDRNSLKDDVIATHRLEISCIMDCGCSYESITPTFGPAWINFYGGDRSYKIIKDYDDQNDGIIEGSAYRGRLLLSIYTDTHTSNISENTFIEAIRTNQTTEVGKVKDFLLFATIFEMGMINSQYKNKELYVEISIGLYGNNIDYMPVKKKKTSDDESELDETSESTKFFKSSSTSPMTATRMKGKGDYSYLELGERKPCLYVISKFEDFRKRMKIAHLLENLVHDYEIHLEFVFEGLTMDDENIHIELKRTIKILSNKCLNCLNNINRLSSVGGARNTPLDKHRFKKCKKILTKVRKDVNVICQSIYPDNIMDKYRECYLILKSLKKIAKEPQGTLPDIFIWLMKEKKRIAYARITASHILSSSCEDTRGNMNGKVQTIFLKRPQKNKNEEASQGLDGKLEIFLWLGCLADTKGTNKEYLDMLPKGYQCPPNYNRYGKFPPSYIIYKEVNYFQLRAYFYQARQMIGMDSTGLSDPYAQVVLTNSNQRTRYIEQTVNPVWNETLIFNDVAIYGPIHGIMHHPPTMIVEFYDYDTAGENEFIGRINVSPVAVFSENYSAISLNILKWYTISRNFYVAGQLLAGFMLIRGDSKELLDEFPPDCHAKLNIYTLPETIKPQMTKFNILVLFWGVRTIKRVNMLSVQHPLIYVEINDVRIASSQITEIGQNSNFTENTGKLHVELPMNDKYWPPILIRCVDCRNFGREVLVGTHTICNISRYIYKKKKIIEPEEVEIDKAVVDKDTPIISFAPPSNDILKSTSIDVVPGNEAVVNIDKPPEPLKINKENETERKEYLAELDWWSKYYKSKNNKKLNSDSDGNDSWLNYISMPTSKMNMTNKTKRLMKGMEKLKGVVNQAFSDSDSEDSISNNGNNLDKSLDDRIASINIYSHELENFPAFSNFEDNMKTYNLYRGKQTSVIENLKPVGSYKGNFFIFGESDDGEYEYKSNFVKRQLPSAPYNMVIRIYIVQARSLHPKDFDGLADPYVKINLGRKEIIDKENRINSTLNPVFGLFYEIDTSFPIDSILRVSVYDYDSIGSDELIGYTKIDLENRYLSKYMAGCGLQDRYETFGYNFWRNNLNPTDILKKMCSMEDIEYPNFKQGEATINGMSYREECSIENANGDRTPSNEPLALKMLLHWKEIAGYSLCGEHVETRSLYNDKRVGVEQGKLEMWIDMFEKNVGKLMPPVAITPRQPIPYELRVAIMNTDEVKLDDVNPITGEASSDIYVRGYVLGVGLDDQSTDVHYRSLTGEGNFNWRYIFNFDYLIAEKKILHENKVNFFSATTKQRIPCTLTLQIWDADIVSSNDHLGSLTINLLKMPRLSKSSKSCTIQQLIDISESRNTAMNIFRKKRARGWLPIMAPEKDEAILAGKIEIDIELLTIEEAEKRPAGRARDDPDALPKPNRPDSSFLWFMNPLKTLRYIILKQYKWLIIKILLFLLLLAFVVLFFYSMP